MAGGQNFVIKGFKPNVSLEKDDNQPQTGVQLQQQDFNRLGRFIRLMPRLRLPKAKGGLAKHQSLGATKSLGRGHVLEAQGGGEKDVTMLQQEQEQDPGIFTVEATACGNRPSPGLTTAPQCPRELRGAVWKPRGERRKKDERKESWL